MELIKSWTASPEKFCEEALKVEFLSTQQKVLLQTLAALVLAKCKKFEGTPLTKEEETLANKIGISVMSGRGTGKDASAAMAIAWFLTCFKKALIPVTAPSAHQLRDVLWKELSKWIHHGPAKDWLIWQSDKIYHKACDGREWFAVGRTANPRSTIDEQTETLSGFHEDYMMIAVDEASGVADPVFNPLEGTLTGKCNFILMIFNPTRSTGFALESHRKQRDRWVCLHWDAEDSELVTKESIEEKAKANGRDSNFFRINVKGLPPNSDQNLLIQWDWVMNAVNRDILPLETDIDVMGLDVGGGDDESVIIRRRGPIAYETEQTSTDNSETLTGWALRRILDKAPQYVMVDAIGMGWGIAGNIRSRQSISQVIDVNVAETASEDKRFHRLRDELWWRLRESFEKGTISIPDDPILIAQLTNIKFDEPGGKIKVEGKNELRKRGVNSPNRADALCMTEYFQVEYLRKMGLGKKKVKRKTDLSWKVI